MGGVYFVVLLSQRISVDRSHSVMLFNFFNFQEGIQQQEKREAYYECGGGGGEQSSYCVRETTRAYSISN
jgi:hypothetical protein